ncbi:hypothetical protein GHT06_015737 [Daphnia sinensis]|uniref:Uncharacterized protein n=1 Tax=Daphnia sinensis TaxID=1820382 RepID=A0AAD5PTL1_9CRUS|nr:hypothetical protein GHT06_015737 [Daphnia sinensis]
MKVDNLGASKVFQSNNLDVAKPNILTELLSPNECDVPSTLKFIYNREITGIAEYLKMYGTFNVNHQTTSRDFHHLASSEGGRVQHRTEMERR